MLKLCSSYLAPTVEIANDLTSADLDGRRSDNIYSKKFTTIQNGDFFSFLHQEATNLNHGLIIKLTPIKPTERLPTDTKSKCVRFTVNIMQIFWKTKQNKPRVCLCISFFKRQQYRQVKRQDTFMGKNGHTFLFFGIATWLQF